MAYSREDLISMQIRQAKVDIGQGMGNALSNAIKFAEMVGYGEMEERKLLDKIHEITLIFFNQSQGDIEEKHQEWIEKFKSKLETEEEQI